MEVSAFMAVLTIVVPMADILLAYLVGQEAIVMVAKEAADLAAPVTVPVPVFKKVPAEILNLDLQLFLRLVEEPK